jgi:uncharacterized protein
MVNADSAYGMSDLVLSGFLRIVTHPRVFKEPSPLDAALSFTTELREHQNYEFIRPGDRHWEIFQRICHDSGVKGNLVSDAFFAALAIESGCVWVTTDRNYARFRGLQWRHPLV